METKKLKGITLPALFFLLFCGFLTVEMQAADTAEDTQGLYLSVFDIDATPPAGSYLAYDQMVNSWDLSLRARGVVITGVGKPIVLCAIDWIGIANDSQDAFKSVLAEAAGTDPKYVVVHTLHQHDAPICDFTAEAMLKEAGLTPTSFNGDFARLTMERLKQAVGEAMKNPQPVTHIKTGSAPVYQVASNRRILKEDGTMEMMRATACRDSALRSKPEGLIDPDVSLISFWNQDKPVAVLSFYATHPQSYYLTKIANPDFPGIARFNRQLAVPEALHIHFNGAGGNIGAGKYNDGSPENRLILAERLCDGMKRAWENSERHAITAKDVAWGTEPVFLPVAEGVVETIKAEMRTKDMRYLTNNMGMLGWIKRQKDGKAIDVNCLTLGNARVLFMPGELFVEYQLAAKALRKDLFVTMAAYGDYGPFYIGTKEAYQQGGYEIQSSPVTAESEAVLMDAISKLLPALPEVSSNSTKYEVGAAAVRIEPTNEIVSVALAGYASPWEGRFSLTWDDMGACDYIAACQMKETVLVLNNKYELAAVDKSSFTSDFGKRIKMNMPVKDIVFFKNKLYGITPSGGLVTADYNAQEIAWQKTKSTIEALAIAASDDFIFVADNNNRLLKGTSPDNEWETVLPADTFQIVSMTCDKNRLYGLSGNRRLKQKSLSHNDPWITIGYKNDVNFTIDLDHIGYIDGHFFATDNQLHAYKSKHSSVGDLKASAMCITKDGETVVIVGVDICGLDMSFTDMVKEEIHKKNGISKDAILINASHSHYTPVTQSWITWQAPNKRPDSLYLLQVVRPGIINAIEQALENRTPSRLYFSKGTTHIGKNRRGIKDYEIYDNTLDVITAVSIKDNKKNILFLTGCHPVSVDPDVNRYTLNANYPGHARLLLEKDPDIEHAIFLQGFAADVNPLEPFRKAGQELADSVKQILKTATTEEIKGDISYYLDTMKIGITPMTQQEVEAFKEANSNKTGDISAERNVDWANIMLDLYQKNQMPDNIPVYCQTLNIGSWKLVALSRETTTEYGLAIRNLWPDKNVSAIAYTNDVSSYLATDPHILAKSYEGYESFFWYAQPGTFPLKTFDKIIALISAKNY